MFGVLLCHSFSHSVGVPKYNSLTAVLLADVLRVNVVVTTLVLADNEIGPDGSPLPLHPSVTCPWPFSEAARAFGACPVETREFFLWRYWKKGAGVGLCVAYLISLTPTVGGFTKEANPYF